MQARVIARDIFVKSPAPGVAVHAATACAARAGAHLMSIHTCTSRSDTCDAASIRFSRDNGRTWSAPRSWPTRFTDPAGTGRRHPRGGYLDPATGRFITLWTEGVLPTDTPLEGMRQFKLHYAVIAPDTGAELVNEQIIHAGAEFDATHPLPGVTVGKNCVMIGDFTCRPLARRDGVILVPAQSSPVGPDGAYHNPAGGLTYTDCLLLMGRWRADGRLAWTVSDRIAGDCRRTSRGLIEPTIAELADGRLLVVMRGSNDRCPDQPGWRWCATSADGGRTFSKPAPWTFTDGASFYSPSSCSQLVPYSDGRLFWMGNVTPANPRGNRPRYPLVLGEVDRQTGLLVRETLAVIDDRQPGESERLTLSNFLVREDPETGHLLLHLTRLFAREGLPDAPPGWTADALLYRIAVD